MATVLSFGSNAENEPSARLRSAIAEHRLAPERTVARPRVEAVEVVDTVEHAGNPIVGLVWGTVLSVPLWALIGLAIRVIAKAV